MSWRRYLRRRWWDQEREREIDAYLETETAENVARGMTRDDALAAARRKFGNPALVREEIYRMNTISWLESTWQDLRYGARLLRLSPGFAIVAIVSLALGIGANTAIFQLLDAVRLRSLPVERPHELAEVKIVGGNHGMGLNPGRYGGLTRPVWELIRDQQRSFSSMFAWAADHVYVGKGTALRQFDGLYVSGGFFNALGVRPWRGRLLLPEDETACPVTRTVVSYRYWLGEMGGRELSAADKLVVNGDLVEIIGVTPPGFFGMAVGDGFDFAQPFCKVKEPRRDIFDVSVMGRLRPGWTIERATAEMDALSPGIFEATTLPNRDARSVEIYKHFRLAVYPASGGVSWLREKYDVSLWLLLGITGLVLLIACANLANLMLARASAREREIAVRLALGASRSRLLRQLLAESGLLAVIGTALGIVLARWLSRALLWSISTDTGAVNLEITTDWRVLLFAVGVAGLTCVIFGVVPALRASHSEPAAAMKAGGRGLTAGRERFSLQRLMVVTQIGVSLVLLVGALLFVRSFGNLMTFNPGIREGGVTVAFLSFVDLHLPRARWAEFERQLLEEVRALPGIQGAATTTTVPLIGSSWAHGVHAGGMDAESKFTWVSPSYFETLGIPVIRGRGFNDGDTATSRRVAVVNKAFVRRFLTGINPIGQSLRTAQEPDYPSTVYEIVGVIPDTKYSDIRTQTPAMAFAPASQYPAQGQWTAMMIYSKAGSAGTIATVRRALGQKHPEMVVAFGDFQKWIRDGMVQERLMAMVSGFFGLLAAVLAMVGLYGVIAYMVARRRNEIGIRLALGADRGQVVGLVMREAGRMLAIGLMAGIVLALLAAQAARTLLFGLSAHDPLTLAGAALLLVAVAGLASLIPARRAAALDPMAALRYE